MSENATNHTPSKVLWDLLTVHPRTEALPDPHTDFGLLLVGFASHSIKAWLTLAVVYIQALPIHLGHLLHFGSRDYNTTHGLALLVSDVIGVLPISYFIMEIVEKKTYVLDFVSTTFFLHFLLCLLYSLQLPSLSWIFGQGAVLACTVMVGECLCAWNMNREILLSDEVAKSIDLGKKHLTTSISEESQPITRNTSAITKESEF